MVLLDNLGIMLAGVFRQPASGNSPFLAGMVTTGGVAFSLRIYDTNGDPERYNRISPLNQAQVGSGTTPPTRQDFDIESPFVVAPESNPANSNLFGYDSGLGKINTGTLISNTGSFGTITEVTKVMRVTNNTGTKVIIIMRDLVSPPVNFISAQSINIEHEVFI